MVACHGSSFSELSQHHLALKNQIRILKPMKLFLFLLACLPLSAQIKPLVGTYLGDNQRNYYGDQAPSKLRIKWKTPLGSGRTMFGTGDVRTWKGAGWTGQPLVIQEGNELYLIQGTLSHHVKK